MEFHRHGLLTTLGFAALTGNSALAMYRSRDDPRAVAFVAGAYGSVALLFHFLRRFECGEGDGGRTRAAVWVLTTLLTAMFALRVAPLMPPAVGALVYMMAAGTAGAGFWALFLRPLMLFHFLRRFEHGEGDGRVIMDALAMGFAVLTCDTALDAYDARRDQGSAAFVFVSYVVLVVLVGLFLRAFARGHAGEQGQGQGQGQH